MSDNSMAASRAVRFLAAARYSGDGHDGDARQDRGCRVREEGQAKENSSEDERPPPLRRRRGTVNSERQVEERLGKDAGVQPGGVRGSGPRGSSDDEEKAAERRQCAGRAHEAEYQEIEGNRRGQIQVRAGTRSRDVDRLSREIRDGSDDAWQQRVVPVRFPSIERVLQWSPVPNRLRLGEVTIVIRVGGPGQIRGGANALGQNRHAHHRSGQVRQPIVDREET